MGETHHQHFRYPLGYYSRDHDTPAHAHSPRSIFNEHSLYRPGHIQNEELIRRSLSDHSALPLSLPSYLQTVLKEEREERFFEDKRDILSWFSDDVASQKERDDDHDIDSDDDVIVLRPVQVHEGDNGRVLDNHQPRRSVPTSSRPFVSGCPSCKVLTTSEHHLTLSAAHVPTAGSDMFPVNQHSSTTRQTEKDQQSRTLSCQESQLRATLETVTSEHDALVFAKASVPSQEDEEQKLQQWKERRHEKTLAIQRSEETVLRPRKKRFTPASTDLVLVTGWEVQQDSEETVADSSRRLLMPITSPNIMMVIPVLAATVMASLITMDWIFRRKKSIQAPPPHHLSSGNSAAKHSAPVTESTKKNPLQQSLVETTHASNVSSLTNEAVCKNSEQNPLQQDCLPGGGNSSVLSGNDFLARGAKWFGSPNELRHTLVRKGAFSSYLDLFPFRVQFWRCLAVAAATTAVRCRTFRVFVTETIRCLWENSQFENHGTIPSYILAYAWQLFASHICGCEAKEELPREASTLGIYGWSTWTSHLTESLSWAHEMKCFGFCAARCFFVIVMLLICHRIVGAFHLGTSVHRVLDLAALFHVLPLTVQTLMWEGMKKGGYPIIVSNTVLSVSGVALTSVGRLWLRWAPLDSTSAKCAGWVLSWLEAVVLSTAYLIAFVVAWNCTAS